MSAYYRVTFQAANNEDLRQAFVLTDEAGAAIDLDGASLRMGLQDTSGNDQLEASTNNGRIAITDTAQGHFELAIPAAVMSTLKAGVYKHDLLLTASGTTRRVWAGTLEVSQGVSE